MAQTDASPPTCARILAFCVLASIQSVIGFGQSSEEIVTDRPDITESSIVVPPGTLQSENGVMWTGEHGKSKLDASESLLRLGVWSRAEVRIELPNYLGSLGGRGNSSGLTDFSAGAKYQVGPLPGAADLAVIAGVSFPTGNHSTSSHGFDPFVKFPWSRELRSGWSVGGMQSLFGTRNTGAETLHGNLRFTCSASSRNIQTPLRNMQRTTRSQALHGNCFTWARRIASRTSNRSTSISDSGFRTLRPGISLPQDILFVSTDYLAPSASDFTQRAHGATVGPALR
jgi:hypothetical protein